MMKTRLIIEIETPDEFVFIGDTAEDYSEEDKENYPKEWHNDLIELFKSLDAENLVDSKWIEEKLNIHFNEDGELPSHRIKVSKVKGDPFVYKGGHN